MIDFNTLSVEILEQVQIFSETNVGFETTFTIAVSLTVKTIDKETNNEHQFLIWLIVFIRFVCRRFLRKMKNG